MVFVQFNDATASRALLTARPGSLCRWWHYRVSAGHCRDSTRKLKWL